MKTMTLVPPAITSLLEEPVAILGYGVSGHAVANLLRSLGIDYLCYDERQAPEVRTQFDAETAKRHRLVVYSPGFRFDHPWLSEARQMGCRCLTELDFASLFWKGKAIAVTGTNGKTTLTEFLAYALKRYRIDAVAVGNNGFPLSRICGRVDSENVLAICEVSSFQAGALEFFKPDALIWTNFHEDHLDRYESMARYFAAKWNLVERLSHSFLLVGTSVAEAATKFGFQLPDFATVVDGLIREEWILPSGSVFSLLPQKENLTMARTYWGIESLPEGALRNAAERFPVRKHRLSKAGEIDGVEFWNDSKATNFSAARAAVGNFGQPVLWIGGGESRGGDIDGFIEAMAGRIRRAYLIGETAPRVGSLLDGCGVAWNRFNSLPNAVNAAFEAAGPGDVILFSPGFSSLDMFRDFSDRGECFENAVSSLKYRPTPCSGRFLKSASRYDVSSFM